MTRWQRRARLAIGLFAVLVAVVVFRQIKPRTPPAASAPAPRSDPGAVVESTGGRIERFNLSKENVRVVYEKQLTYENGTAKLIGVTVMADEKDGEGTFTATGREATVGKDATTVDLSGDVRLESRNVRARTDRATFAKSDNVVRAAGPVDLAEGSTTAKGVGMTFDRNRDVLTILDQAVVHLAGDGGASEITCGTATFNRRERTRQFDRNVRMQRGAQTIEADSAVAYLSEDEKRIDTLQLRGVARIATPNGAPGSLRNVSGRDITLKYAADGGSVEHVVIGGDAVLEVAGDKGKAGRQIAAAVMDISLAPDSTPTALVARDRVQLILPAEGAAGARTIRATTLDAKGTPGRGLTRAVFTGDVQYRESGAAVTRAVSAGALDVALKPGLASFDDARFSRSVRFEEGSMAATAAAIRYDVERGALALSGSDAAAPVPRIVNEQIAVDAAKIDVTLEGPVVKASASGNDRVKSVLKPAPKDADPAKATKVPAMLKADQPINVTALSLDYDGATSKAAYSGSAQLWQGDTSIRGDTIAIDGKSGDLAATTAMSTTMLEETGKDKKKERVRSTATAKELKYEDTLRRLTYTGDAHMTGPEGDMTAARIELYLKPSGDELERAEAYDDVTLREQNRKTTGTRMTYTTADERYVVVGAPVKIVDQCERETVGKTLTFLKATDSIVVDGNQQMRTLTKGGNGKCTP